MPFGLMSFEICFRDILYPYFARVEQGLLFYICWLLPQVGFP
jgi:hypothetical protein